MDLRNMQYYTFSKGKFAGVDNVLVSATGYTGAGGFEVYVENAHAKKLWDAIFESGKQYGIKPIGLGARDTLRLEMGFVFTEMILTIPHHRSKQVLDGLQNSPRNLQTQLS
jgi:aminomethyltransferase